MKTDIDFTFISQLNENEKKNLSLEIYYNLGSLLVLYVIMDPFEINTSISLNK